MYTEWYWQIDLHNLFRFLRLRMDSHAWQYEIRVYADAMAECARAVAPLAYEAFEQHILGSVRLSRAECIALQAMLSGQEHGLTGRAANIFEEAHCDSGSNPNRRAGRAKAASLGSAASVEPLSKVLSAPAILNISSRRRRLSSSTTWIFRRDSVAGPHPYESDQGIRRIRAPNSARYELPRQ
ncbi:MAG: FAD-dependent thymidylate synthase [Fimbriimonadaceae bacterium]